MLSSIKKPLKTNQRAQPQYAQEKIPKKEEMLVLRFEEPPENRLPSPKRKTASYMGEGSGTKDLSIGKVPPDNKKNKDKRERRKKRRKAKKKKKSTKESKSLHISKKAKLNPLGNECLDLKDLGYPDHYYNRMGYQGKKRVKWAYNEL